MLSWHILWMSRHARAMAAELRDSGPGGAPRPALARRAGGGRRRRRDARGRRGGAVPLRHRRRRPHTDPLSLATGGVGGPGAGLRRLLAAVSRPGRHPAAPPVQRHQRPDRAARRRHGWPGRRRCCIPPTCCPAGASNCGIPASSWPTTASSAAACMRWSATPRGRRGIQLAAWLATLAAAGDRLARHEPAAKLRAVAAAAAMRRR